MKKFLCILILLPAVCLAQSTSGFHRVSQVITRSNSGAYAQVVPNARVFVQNTSSGIAATIYSDPALTLTIPGAIVTSDNNGNYSYYMPLNVCVTENISSPSQGSLVIPNICGNSGTPLPLSTLNGGTGATAAPLGGQLLVGQTGSVYAPKTLVGDCSMVAAGSITCTKTNGVSFTYAATTPIGTSGAVIPLLSGGNTWSQNNIFGGSSTSGTTLGIYNSTGKNWVLSSQGSAQTDGGNFDISSPVDGVTVLSLSNIGGSILGDPICTHTNGQCPSSGTVTSFSAPAGSWPTWLVPTVTNPTTTPSVAVTASPIPNSALANSSTTINGTVCTLGGTCSITGTSRTCNANGCYFIQADGTIVEWGVSATCTTGATSFTCGSQVTYPYPFTTSANISVTATAKNCTNNCFVNVFNVNTTGFVSIFGAAVFVGGTGGNLPGSQVASWVAIGN